MRSKPNLVSLCGIADDATEANLSGLGMDADGAAILASELPDKAAMTSLDISSNGIGICDDLPEGWTYDGSYNMCYRNKDGNKSSPPSGVKSSGVIAIANAIGDVEAMAVLNLGPACYHH
jgi:hypothetical protein